MEHIGATRDKSVQSVDRAISILQVLAANGPCAVTEIATELEIHKSTVFRLLATLEARGLVSQNATRGRYHLGYGVVQLAAGATRTLDLSVISRQVCEDLAEAVGETVNVAITDGTSVISIDQVIGSSAVTSVNWVGQRTALHATAAGKVFLAHMSPHERDSLLSGRLERFTKYTITSRDVLEQQLPEIRRAGYSLTVEEYEIGLTAVAAPIGDLEGGVQGTVVVSGPSFRLNDETLPSITEHLLNAASAISRRNGLPKPG